MLGFHETSSEIPIHTWGRDRHNFWAHGAQVYRNVGTSYNMSEKIFVRFSGGPPRRRTKVLANPRKPGKPDAKKRRHHPTQTDGRTEKTRGVGWCCSCDPRSCRAVVEKTGQRPPVGTPPHPTTPGDCGRWAAGGAVRRGLHFPMRPWMCPYHIG